MGTIGTVDMTVNVNIETSGARFILRALVFHLKIYGWLSTMWAKIRGKTSVQVVINITYGQNK